MTSVLGSCLFLTTGSPCFGLTKPSTIPEQLQFVSNCSRPLPLSFTSSFALFTRSLTGRSSTSTLISLLNTGCFALLSNGSLLRQPTTTLQSRRLTRGLAVVISNRLLLGSSLSFESLRRFPGLLFSGLVLGVGLLHQLDHPLQQVGCAVVAGPDVECKIVVVGHAQYPMISGGLGKSFACPRNARMVRNRQSSSSLCFINSR